MSICRINHALNDLLLDIHAASMSLPSDEFERHTLERVRSVIDFDFAIWGAGDGMNRELHSAHVIDQTDKLFNTWEPVKEVDPFANLVIGNTGQTWTTDQVPDFHHARAYREHWGLYRARTMIATMKIDPETGLHVFITLARDLPNTRFSHADVELKNIITQHLFLAARHNDQRQLTTCEGPVALLDAKGLVHASTPVFRDLVAQEWGRPAAKRLPDAVNERLWCEGEYRSAFLSLSTEPSGSRLLVRIRYKPPQPLSPREMEIAIAYAHGQSYKEVAQDLGLSPTTVRSHLSRAYQKLSIRDKGALATWLGNQS